MKKRHVIKIEDKVDKALKVKASRKKKILVKQINTKSFKVSVFISSLVDKPLLNIKALFMNTNIIILALYLF